jgi:hypothetical protein
VNSSAHENQPVETGPDRLRAVWRILRTPPAFAYTVTFNDIMPFENYWAVLTLEDAGKKAVAR